MQIGWNETENTFFEGPEMVGAEAALKAALAKKVGSADAAEKLLAEYGSENPAVTDNECISALPPTWTSVEGFGGRKSES